MSDDLNTLILQHLPSPQRPLLGLTVLVVEDSRFASEAMRLLCLRSGARIRRADCLASAYRHLQTYRPGVVIVDMGLPDGSGADLIRSIRAMRPLAPVILGTSGDPETEADAMSAGADGFLAKPLENLAAFQNAILAALPEDHRPVGIRAISDEVIHPDPIALHDDLNHMADMLSEEPDARALHYAAQFLMGVARSAHDDALATAASALGRKGGPSAADLSRLNSLMQQRLASGAAL